MQPSPTSSPTRLLSPIREIAPGSRALQVTWADGEVSEFHYVWLRDNCPALRHPGNGQRISAVTDFPLDLTPADVRLEADGTVSLRWAFDQHVSRYKADWLREHCYTGRREEAEPAPLSPRTWTAEDWADGLPALSYSEFMHNDEALQGWLAAVHAYGFAVLEDVPVTPGFVLKIVARFAYVRETNYGRIFDEHVIEEPNNLAFTNLWLRPHTDNPYRDPVPTLQLMHCLENDSAAAAEGGWTTLSDGFRVADDLRRRAPELFSLLATLPVRFAFADRDTVLSAQRPLIEMDPRSGNVQSVYFNHRSTAPFDVPGDLMLPFYDAYRTFADMLEDQHYRIQFPMRPGTLYIVDNRRVLHGRTACTSGGRRHVQGCYADRDGLLSKLAVLERGRRDSAGS